MPNGRFYDACMIHHIPSIRDAIPEIIFSGTKDSYFRFWCRNNTFTNEYDRYFECAKRGNNISSPFGGFMKENSTFPCFLVFVLCLFLGGFSGFEQSFFRLLFFFSFQRERAHSCGHFPGPESFIRRLSLEKGLKEVSNWQCQ